MLEERVVVMYWLRKGKASDEIGQIMGRKVGTVKKHLNRIYDKLGVPNRTAAAYYADLFFSADE